MVPLRRASFVLGLLLIVGLTTGAASRPKYQRSLYPHWIDADGDCQDARVEVLIRDARPNTIRFENAQECKVVGVEWDDPTPDNA